MEDTQPEAGAPQGSDNKATEERQTVTQTSSGNTSEEKEETSKANKPNDVDPKSEDVDGLGEKGGKETLTKVEESLKHLVSLSKWAKQVLSQTKPSKQSSIRALTYLGNPNVRESKEEQFYTLAYQCEVAAQLANHLNTERIPRQEKFISQLPEKEEGDLWKRLT